MQFDKRLWREVMKRCLIDSPETNWNKVVEWGWKVSKVRALKLV
jgi:hypothetical protein